MKKFLLLAAILFTFSIGIFAQPKTVTDYFLAMPDNLYSTNIEGIKINGRAALTKHRKSLIKIEDIQNGYLKLEGPWEGWAEIALFKKTDGSYIIAQAESGCGPACEGFVKFWTYNAGKWTDVTKSVFEAPGEKEVAKKFNSIKPESDEAVNESGMSFYYNLPRKGRIMKVACNECSQVIDGEPDFTIMRYEWNGTRFIRM